MPAELRNTLKTLTDVCQADIGQGFANYVSVPEI